MNRRKIACVVIRIVLSLTFLLSGISKCFYIRGFAEEIAQYCDLYISSAFSTWKEVMAVGLCCLEILLGLALLVAKVVKAASFLAFLLLSFFVYITGVNYFFPTILGSVESCGCFGELIHFTPLASFVKSVLLWALSIIPLKINLMPKRVANTHMVGSKNWLCQIFDFYSRTDW